jgi:hypothetical protein
MLGAYPDSLEARASLLDAIYTRTSERRAITDK